MSYARRRSRLHEAIGMGPGDFYRRRQRRRGLTPPAATPGGPTLEQACHPEALIAAYDALAARGGKAPGPDGLTYADLGRGEACALLRDLAKPLRDGSYRPGRARAKRIAKTGGGWRTLAIANLLDRVVGAALNRALSPYFEAIFSPCSYGFRQGRSTWDLLADLMAAMAALRITTLAIDDVKRAFDNVPIAPLMEAFAEHIADPRLLQLVESVLRGGDDRDRAVGIPQGSPLSPLALNVMLDKIHDRPLTGDPDFPPLFRYADNLVYLCESVPEGHRVLDHVGQLLAHAGLALKGVDGDPVDLREGGEASLLGFRLALRDGRLRLGLGEDALGSDLAQTLTETHDDPDPHRMARSALRGWVAAYGPALGDLTEDDAGTILDTAARHGFRELASREELTNWCTAAHGRWEGLCEKALTRRRLTGEDDLFVAAPPATMPPGG